MVTKILKIRVILALLFGIAILNVGCGEATDGAQTCDAAIASSGYLASKDCRILSWGRNLPITITKEADLPADLSDAIDRAVEVWEAATGIDLFYVDPNPIGVQTSIDHQFNIIGVRGGEQWSSAPIEGHVDQPAKTLYYYKDTLFNSNIFFNETFLDGKRGKYNSVSIALHELGHVLGLDHDDTDSPDTSIMKSTIHPKESRQLTERDITRVRGLYDSF